MTSPRRFAVCCLLLAFGCASRPSLKRIPRVDELQGAGAAPAREVPEILVTGNAP
jgi:hypothetical protein